MRSLIIALLCVVVAACGDRNPTAKAGAIPHTRLTVVWVDEDVDDDLAAALRRAGVSWIVSRRGTVNLESATPLLSIVAGPQIAGGVPAASAIRIETGDRALSSEMGESLWRGLGPALGGAPVELVIDMPRLPEGTPGFVTRLAATSGLDVVPVLTVEQVGTERGLAVAQAAGRCIVPLFGAGGGGLRGAGQDGNDPLVDRLQSLLGGNVGLRAAIILKPRVNPPLQGWGEGFRRLCERGNSEVKTTSELGRRFVFLKEMEWSHRSWRVGESVDVGWMDCARLNSAFADLDRLILPDVVGWDLVSLPPRGDALGMGREALFAYLEGRGPGPELTVVGERDGRLLRVRVANTSPFSSAVSRSGHWFEVAIAEGVLAVRDRGDFETITLGSRRQGGDWKAGVGSGANAVRFGETFIGPGEKLRSGVIRLPSSRVAATIRWRIVLSNGETVQGLSDS